MKEFVGKRVVLRKFTKSKWSWITLASAVLILFCVSILKAKSKKSRTEFSSEVLQSDEETEIDKVKELAALKARQEGQVLSGKYNIHFLNVPIAHKRVSALGLDYPNFNDRVLQCFVYPKVAILEIDENDVGAANLFARPLKKGAPIDVETLCDERYNGEQIEIKSEPGYFVGIFGDYAVRVAAEPDGLNRTLGIYDWKSGEKDFSLEYYEGEGALFDMDPVSRDVKLTYSKFLDASCLPTQLNDTCWNAIKLRNRISAKLKLPAPDCSEVSTFIRQFSDKDMNSHFAIAARVTLIGLRNSRYVFHEDPPVCVTIP